MPITITIDNDRNTAGTQGLFADETAGVQTPQTVDDGNEIDVTLTAGVLGGFDAAFNTFLNSLNLSAAREEFARDHDGASSTANFVLVTTTAGETINDLFFADANGQPLNGDVVAGMTTLDGEAVKLYTDGTFGSSGDFCVAATASGDVVAAFYLKESADHKSAQVQMVTFEPLLHTNASDPDDALNFTDVLRVSASGSMSFDFDALKSGSSLWCAVGNSSAGLLVTGGNPLVDSAGKKTNVSDVIHTSQGGAGATIGVNNQLFDNVGETAVFTLVTGFNNLVGADAGATGDYVIDPNTSDTKPEGIDYSGYMNVTGAGIFISQSQGNDLKNLDINLFEAGGDAGGAQTAEDGTGYIPGLASDTLVNVATVTVKNELGQTVGVWSVSPSGTQLASGATVGTVKVTISGNNIDVDGVKGMYTISWTSVGGETFNRFEVVGEGGQFDIGRVDVTQTVPSNSAVGDKLFVDDDGPALSGLNVSKQVDEDELSTSASPPADTSNGITDNDSDIDEVTYSNADLQAVVSSGTDTPATFALNLAVSGAVKDIDGNSMTSKGEAMTWSVSGGVISAVAGGRVVFTITQTAGAATPNDPTDDVFTVDLRDQIDHPNASGDNGVETLDLTPAFSAKDADSDPVDLNGANNLATPIRLIVENDVPALSGQNATVRVDEDELSTSAPAPADASNGITDNDSDTDEASLTVAALQAIATPGADEPVNFALNLSVSGAVKDIDGNAMTSKGQAITWSVNGNVIEAVAGGRVVFTVTHNNNGTPNDASDDSFDIDLRDQIDHPNASGDTGIETLDLTPAFTARDFDGDPIDLNGADNLQTPIQLIVENDVPTLSGQNVSKQVDEDELSTSAAPPADASTGITDNDGNTDEVSYSNADLQAAVTSGADEPATFALNLSVSGAVKDIDGNSMTSKGDAMTWSVSGGVISAVAGGRVVFTITQTAGANTPNDPTDDVFTVDLRDQLDHDNASGDNGIETLDLTPAFSAKDFDGDPVDLNGADNLQTPIRLVVENDVPALSGQNASIRVEEDELSTSAPAPADTSNGITDNDAHGDEAVYTNAALNAVVNPGADEPASFALNLSVSGAVKDIDGNAMTSKGEAITWSVSGGVVSAVAGGRVVFTVTQTAGTGTPNDPSDDVFTVDLRDQIDHPNASGDDGIETLNLTPAFTAKDFDGDAVDLSGGGTEETIQLVVENDVPAPKPNVSHSEEVHEDALTGGNPDGDGETETLSVTYTKAELTALANAGADEDLSFSLNTAASGSAGAIIGTNVVTTGGANVLCKGAQVMWAAGDSAGSLKGVVTIGGVTTTVFTLTPSGNDFVFNLVDQVDHSGAENDQELLGIDLTSAFKAVDFDNDPLTLNPDSVVLNVENDLPTFSSQIASKTLDWVDESSVSDSLNGRVGGDEPASYTIDKYTDLDGYTEALSSDGKTLTYSKDGKVYFELKLDDAANSGAGGYTFTVKEPPPQEPIEFNFDNLESGNFLWVAVGGKSPSGTASEVGLLVTGSRLNLNADGTAVSGGKTASDQVNTSQGGAGATIGIDNQMFTPGDSGIFTFVNNFVPLNGTDGDATGQDIDQIVHNGYRDLGAASLFISQKQGNTKLDLTMNIYKAGSAAGDEDADNLGGGAYASGGNLSGSGKNQVLNKSTTFLNDTAVALDSVEVSKPGANGDVLVGIWTTDFALADQFANDNIYREGTPGAEGIMVDIKADGRAGNTVMNSADINGVDAFYSIKMVAEAGETFNRIELQADSGKFDIGKFVLEEGQDTPDVDLEFSVAIEDKDGDLNNFNGTNDVFDDFKIKVDGTGEFDNANTAPTGFTTSYDFPETLTSTALKSAGFIDDSGMAPAWAELQQDMLLM